MNLALTVVFWAAALILVWIYLGYPAWLWIFSALFGRETKVDQSFRPSVSVMIMTYNEAMVIEQKIKNTLLLRYPPGRFEIVVVDSNSDDGTVDIVQHFADRGVRLISQTVRAGKAAAVNAGLAAVRGEIVIVTDANAMMDPGVLDKIMPHFADPTVGGVTGAMQQRDQSGTAQAQSGDLYWRFEKFLRRHESKLHSVIGMSGEISVYRRNIFFHDGAVVDWYVRGAADDFEATLYMIRHGWRVVYEPSAQVWEPAADNPADLATQKIRNINLTMPSIRHNWRMIFNPGYGWYGLFIFPARKILPLISPWLLIIIFFTSLSQLAFGIGWVVVVAAQVMLYLLWAASTIPGAKKQSVLRLVDFFFMLNVFVVRSWINYWRRRDYTIWDKVDSTRVAIKSS